MNNSFNWKKEKEREKRLRDDYSWNAYDVANNQMFEKHLKKLYGHKNFDRQAFEDGIKYFESGLTLDELDEEHKNNSSFISGYKHAKHLALVKELEEEHKKGRNL